MDNLKRELPEKVIEEIKRNEKQGVTPKDIDEFILNVRKFYREHPCEIDLFNLARMITRRLKSDRDLYCCVEGLKGNGKSNLVVILMIIMARYTGFYRDKRTGQIIKVLARNSPMNENHYERLTCAFDFEKNLSFLDQVSILQERFNSLDRYMAFGIDEGSKNLHKQNWQTKIQFKLVQLSDTERWQNKAFFICIPNFKELNSNFRNDRIQIRLYIYTRKTKEGYASAIISMRDPGRWSSDPWFVEENENTFEWILRKRPLAMRTPEDIIRAERKLKGYCGEIHIPSLKLIAPNIWNTYMAYKITNAKKELSEEVEGETIEQRQNNHLKYALKKMMAFVKLKFPGIRYADFSKLTTIPAPILSNIWREEIKVIDPFNTFVDVDEESKKINLENKENQSL
jgi:hypothetical protein